MMIYSCTFLTSNTWIIPVYNAQYLCLVHPYLQLTRLSVHADLPHFLSSIPRKKRVKGHVRLDIYRSEKKQIMGG